MSETFLNSTIDLNDGNINIDGYSILRADHPSNNKRGGVCIYFKQSLPLIRRDDLSTMQEAIVTEISVENETCFFTCFYRPPSQSHYELENFCSELNLLLTNINNNQPACSILTADFNVECSKCCSSDKNNIAGLEIDITTTAGYSQLTNKQTFYKWNFFLCWFNFFFQRKFYKKLWNRTIHLREMSSQHYIWYSWLQCTSTPTLL